MGIYNSKIRRHMLKTWPEPFAAVLSGAKPYEIRVDDRNFAPGDILDLMEWNPHTRSFTGESASAVICHKTNGGQWSLPNYVCVLGLANITLNPPPGLRRAIDHFTPNEE